MSVDKVRKYLEKFGAADRIMEFDVSSATVPLAAKALGCEEARIAKTLAFKTEEACVLIVAAGDTKVDNKKFREVFKEKAKMIAPEEVESLIGYKVGGVCPFAVNDGVDIYLDESLKRFKTVFPACGSANSAIELSIDELLKFSGAKGFVAVTKFYE